MSKIVNSLEHSVLNAALSLSVDDKGRNEVYEVELMDGLSGFGLNGYTTDPLFAYKVSMNGEDGFAVLNEADNYGRFDFVSGDVFRTEPVLIDKRINKDMQDKIDSIRYFEKIRASQLITRERISYLAKRINLFYPNLINERTVSKEYGSIGMLEGNLAVVGKLDAEFGSLEKIKGFKDVSNEDKVAFLLKFNREHQYKKDVGIDFKYDVNHIKKNVSFKFKKNGVLLSGMTIPFQHVSDIDDVLESYKYKDGDKVFLRLNRDDSTIIENGKPVNLKDSKFKSFYEIELGAFDYIPMFEKDHFLEIDKKGFDFNGDYEYVDQADINKQLRSFSKRGKLIDISRSFESKKASKEVSLEY